MSRSSQLPNLEQIFNKDEDEQDFAPLGGSNLAALFGTSQKLGEDGSSTSLKQPLQKKPSSGTSTPQTLRQNTNKKEVIISNVVFAYKLENGQYSQRGRLGVALIGNASARVYQIILYTQPRNYLSVATLSPEFVYTFREKNYATYYDDKNENWSLLFTEEKACIEFAREVGISRYLSRESRDSDDTVMYQNLTYEKDENKNGVAKEGDEIIVKAVICPFVAQPFKSNVLPTQTMKVEISQDENWERSLLNSSLGLKRLLILPPSKQISLGPGFPRHVDILLEIEVVDIINRKANKSPEATKPPIPLGNKASILSRMAKMGQSMLPKVPNSTTTDSEDTEDEVHIKSPRRLKAEVATSHATKHQPRPQSQNSTDDSASPANVLVPRSIVPTTAPLIHGPVIPTSAFSNPWPSGPIQQRYVTMDNQYYPVHQAPIAQPIPAGIDPNINIFLSETRTQNSEIRMGMAKISDNVQKLLDKFHVLEVQSASSPLNERAMETSLKMLIALNSAKNDARESKTSIQNTENPEVVSLGDDKSKELIAKLEKELSKAKELLSNHSNKIGALEAEMLELNCEKSELSGKVQGLQKSLTDTRQLLQKSNADLKKANDLADSYQAANAALEAEIFKIKEKKNLLEKRIDSLQSSETKQPSIAASATDKATEIKEIMNKTFQTLSAKFTEDSYETQFIKQTLASTIRNITLQVLKEDKVGKEEESVDKPKVGNFELTSKIETEETGDDASFVSSEKSTSLLDSVDLNDSSTSTVPAALDEPPPIPPMDMDAEGDWLP